MLHGNRVQIFLFDRGSDQFQGPKDHDYRDVFCCTTKS